MNLLLPCSGQEGTNFRFKPPAICKTAEGKLIFEPATSCNNCLPLWMLLFGGLGRGLADQIKIEPLRETFWGACIPLGRFSASKNFSE